LFICIKQAVENLLRSGIGTQVQGWLRGVRRAHQLQYQHRCRHRRLVRTAHPTDHDRSKQSHAPPARPYV